MSAPSLDETVAGNFESMSMITGLVLRQSDCQSLGGAHMVQRLARPEQFDPPHLAVHAGRKRRRVSIGWSIAA